MHHTSCSTHNTMRIRQTHPHLLPKQHWTRLLVLLMTLITGILSDGKEFQVCITRLGSNAFFNFNVTKDMAVILAEWSRCSSEKVFVFSPENGLYVPNNSYTKRLSVKSNHSIMLERLQETDFGTYCYKLTTFPLGTLQGQTELVKITSSGENGLFITVMSSVSCGVGFIILCGIIAGGVCYKKRKSPANAALDPGGRTACQKKNKSKRVQIEGEEQDDDNYLNIP